MTLKRHRLAQRRQARGFTQEALAEHLQVDRSTIVRWESGRGGPQPWMRPRLTAALRVTTEQLQDLLTDTVGEITTSQTDRREYALRHPERSDLGTCAPCSAAIFRT